MTRDSDGAGKSDSDRVPPFWLRAANGDHPIDPTVINVAKENWPWTFRLAEQDLHDGACALEIVERTAIEVSKRLQEQPEVGRHLTAYYRTAFTNRIRRIAARNSRLHYEGSPQDLETNYKATAPNGIKLFEDRMVLGALLPHTTEKVRRILRYRLLDYSWKEIAQQLGIAEKQAKSRFYYGIQSAHQRLSAAQERRIRGEVSAELE